MKYLILCIAISLSCTACNSKKTYVEKHQGDSEIESLNTINLAAIALIDEYNKNHKTEWLSLEPNAKVLVEKCKVPLTTDWIYEIENNKKYWSVIVKCSDAVNNTDGWSVKVPSSRVE